MVPANVIGFALDPGRRIGRVHHRRRVRRKKRQNQRRGREKEKYANDDESGRRRGKLFQEVEEQTRPINDNNWEYDY